MVLETFKLRTFDGYFSGVATYMRESEWNAQNCARVTVNDSASDHGWQGIMTRSDWTQKQQQQIAA